MKLQARDSARTPKCNRLVIHDDRECKISLDGKLIIRFEAEPVAAWTICRVNEPLDNPLEVIYHVLARYPTEQAAEAACRELLSKGESHDLRPPMPRPSTNFCG